ncbi:MAG: tRNA epoxyqueuosine(34) reductase QueG, partial [Burkholderiales bacterium]
WNRFAQPSGEADFAVRHGLDSAALVDLFGWSEYEFHQHLAGSAIHRIGYERWLRNLAVGMGNALSRLAGMRQASAITLALERRGEDPSPLVREHVAWALSRRAN